MNALPVHEPHENRDHDITSFVGSEFGTGFDTLNEEETKMKGILQGAGKEWINPTKKDEAFGFF